MFSQRELAASLAIVTALCIGCKKADDSASMDTAAVGATAATAIADTTAQAAPPETQADPSISSMSDENIVAKLEEGDQKEVDLSNSLQSKATNSELRDYMKMLATDHAKARSDIKALAQKAKLAATPPTGDTSKKELADLKSRFQKLAKGLDFDSAFVNYAIEDHKKDIADSQAMQSQAKSQELKDEIGKDMPVLQKHLDKAQELSGKIH